MHWTIHRVISSWRKTAWFNKSVNYEALIVNSKAYMIPLQRNIWSTPHPPLRDFMVKFQNILAREREQKGHKKHIYYIQHNNSFMSNLGSFTSALSFTCCPLSSGITFTTSSTNTWASRHTWASRPSPEQKDTMRLSLSRTFWTKPTLLCLAPCHP